MRSLKVDQDEFQGWKDNPLTQAVLQHFQARAVAELERTQALVLQYLTQPAAAWADQQGQAAYLKGHCDAFAEVADVRYEDIFDDIQEVDK